MHTLKIAVVEPGAGVGFAELRTAISQRLDRVPTMRWRLAFPPGGRGRPSWVEDDELDLDRHLVHLKQPQPISYRELYDLVARAAEAPLLNRDRPLWEMWVVDGLVGGRLALITRVHHAFADGVSFARILASWFAPEPIASPPAAGRPPGALKHVARMIFEGASDMARQIAAFIRASRASERAETPDIPPSPFSGRPLGPGRAFGCRSLDLDAIHAARKPLDATVNDVLIALVSAALDGYLRELGTPSPGPLVALVPVSLLTTDDQRPIGNRGLASMTVQLPTEVADPVARVRAANAAAKQAKQELAATAGARLEDAVDLLPRAGIREVARLIDSGRILPLGNLALSNVRGPAEALAADGFNVEDFFSVGPCAPGIGLNITAWSYAGRFNVSMLVDSRAIPDPWPILDRLRLALDELLRAVRQTTRTD